MYNSLKRQNRMRGPGKGSICCAPVKSGRVEGSMATSEEGDLIAISNAIRFGDPIYLIRADIGTTLDVLLHKDTAIKRRDAINERNYRGRPFAQVYERQHTMLVKI